MVKAMASEVFILVGSPGVGKSWISQQLKNKFHVVEHDNYRNPDIYVTALHAASVDNPKVLGNTPFGISQIMEKLAERKIAVTPVFIIEPEDVLKKRYRGRTGKDIPQGHITRQHTYRQRAKDLGSFYGTSDEVLTYLRSI